ncbi:MAG: S1 RNA-binding domain-containing protein [Bacillota bacterium]|nr:S1 RNA-binding domain-containing protein [Bacillota bacterium]
MAISIGQILPGKVVKITNFGAFVRLEEGTEGLVHISELSNSFVKKVEDVLSLDQEVQVKVISEENSKYAFSIKQALAKEEAKEEKFSDPFGENKNLDPSFEEKLSLFMKQSNEKLQQARARENKRNNKRKKQ